MSGDRSEGLGEGKVEAGGQQGQQGVGMKDRRRDRGIRLGGTEEGLGVANR